MALPLAGVRILDLTAVIAGPLATHQLVMLGAEVIKIEPPEGGDLSRRLGAVQDLNAQFMGVSFWSTNAGKKSVSLNLKDPEGKALFLRMVKDAHCVVENFRPGAMKRLGLDYDVLKEVNPGIIYCAVSGFGQDGPLAQRPSFDQIIQGFCGIMSLTGDADTAPMRAGYVVCDTMVAMAAATAISAALYRQKATGQGEFIDVSMLDSALSTMACWVISNYVNGGKVPAPMGNDNPASAPSGAFRTKEGLLNIVCNDEKQFVQLCNVIGLPDLPKDPRFVTRVQRVINRAELTPTLEAALAQKTALEWEPIFADAAVPAGPILTLPQVLEHPQIKHRELLKTFKNVPGVDRDVVVPKLGFRMRNGNPDVDIPPPSLGEHTAQELARIGLDEAAVAALKARGVV
jgi:CoA:oxalate CoA-transferase